MAVVKMTREALHSKSKDRGALYHEKVVVSAGQTSDIYVLPYTEVYSITVNIEGGGVIEFSNDSPTDLVADVGTFEPWDGTSIINIGVVAFRVVGGTGNTTATIAVKTASV